MTDFSKILEKAKEIELKVKESQEKIKNIKAEGSSGGGQVKIVLNGDGEIESLKISDSLFKDDKTLLEDLVIAAHNNAKNNLKTKTSDELSKVTGGFGIPGFKWPL